MFSAHMTVSDRPWAWGTGHVSCAMSRLPWARAPGTTGHGTICHGAAGPSATGPRAIGHRPRIHHACTCMDIAGMLHGCCIHATSMQPPMLHLLQHPLHFPATSPATSSVTCIQHVWSMHATCVQPTWNIFGTCMKHTSNTHATHMQHTTTFTNMHATSAQHPCNMSGTGGRAMSCCSGKGICCKLMPATQDFSSILRATLTSAIDSSHS